MCEKKEDQADLTLWLRLLSTHKAQSEEPFMDHLRQVIRCLPPGTWSLVIRVDEPARYELPSIQQRKSGSRPYGST